MPRYSGGLNQIFSGLPLIGPTQNDYCSRVFVGSMRRQLMYAPVQGDHLFIQIRLDILAGVLRSNPQVVDRAAVTIISRAV